MVDCPGACRDFGCQLLWGGGSVFSIKLNTEIAVRAAGVMTGGQDNATDGTVFNDDMRWGGRWQNAVLSDDNASELVGNGYFKNGLNRAIIVIPAIAADNQCFPFKIFKAVKDGLNKIFNIVLLFNNRYFFSKSWCAECLVGVRFCFYSGNINLKLPLFSWWRITL